MKVGGTGVAVGGAIGVSATPVYAAAKAVLCMLVMLMAGFVAGAQAVNVRMSKVRIILVFMVLFPPVMIFDIPPLKRSL